MSSLGSACFAHRSPHYSFAFHWLPPRLSETAPHTIPSHVASCPRVFRRPLPTLFRHSSSVGSGSLGDSDVHPSPFVPPLLHTARSVAVGRAALPLSGDVTLFCACRRLALPVSETAAHMTLLHFISWFRLFRRPLPTRFRCILSICSASLGDCLLLLHLLAMQQMSGCTVCHAYCSKLTPLHVCYVTPRDNA